MAKDAQCNLWAVVFEDLPFSVVEVVFGSCCELVVEDETLLIVQDGGWKRLSVSELEVFGIAFFARDHELICLETCNDLKPQLIVS